MRNIRLKKKCDTSKLYNLKLNFKHIYFHLLTWIESSIFFPYIYKIDGTMIYAYPKKNKILYFCMDN